MMKFPFDRIGKFTSCRIRMLRCTTSSKLSACSCSVMGFHKLHVLSFFIAQLPLLCLICSSNTAASKNQNCQISNIDKMTASYLMFASSLKRSNVTKGGAPTGFCLHSLTRERTFAGRSVLDRSGNQFERQNW